MLKDLNLDTYLQKEKKFFSSNYKIEKNIGTYYFYVNKNESNYIINNDLSILLSTSGSLGSPKFVKLSRQNIFNNTIDIIKALKISEKDRCITTLIPSYTYGMSIINTHLYSGSSLVMVHFQS